MQKEEEREKNFFQFWKDIPYDLKIQKERDSMIKLWNCIVFIKIYGIN